MIVEREAETRWAYIPFGVSQRDYTEVLRRTAVIGFLALLVSLCAVSTVTAQAPPENAAGIVPPDDSLTDTQGVEPQATSYGVEPQGVEPQKKL